MPGPLYNPIGSGRRRIELQSDKDSQELVLIGPYGDEISRVSVSFLMNEGIAFTWNEQETKLELRNRENAILSSIDASLFVSQVAKSLSIVGNNIVLNDASGNLLSSAPLSINSVQDLPQALGSKVDKSSIVAENANPTLHKIAEINGTPINETVTELVTPLLDGNELVLKFINENGIEQSVSVDLSPIQTTDINVENASYNAATNIISITETDGEEHKIDLSELSVRTNTDAQGITILAQEGTTKLIVSKAGQSGSYEDLLFKPDLSVFAKDHDVVKSVNNVRPDANGNLSLLEPAPETVVNDLVLTSEHNNQRLIITGIVNLTVPSGLPSNFYCYVKVMGAGEVTLKSMAGDAEISGGDFYPSGSDFEVWVLAGDTEPPVIEHKESDRQKAEWVYVGKTKKSNNVLIDFYGNYVRLMNNNLVKAQRKNSIASKDFQEVFEAYELEVYLKAHSSSTQFNNLRGFNDIDLSGFNSTLNELRLNLLNFSGELRNADRLVRSVRRLSGAGSEFKNMDDVFYYLDVEEWDLNTGTGATINVECTSVDIQGKSTRIFELRPNVISNDVEYRFHNNPNLERLILNYITAGNTGFSFEFSGSPKIKEFTLMFNDAENEVFGFDVSGIIKEINSYGTTDGVITLSPRFTYENALTEAAELQARDWAIIQI